MADRIGELVSAHVIPNPYDDTEQLVSQFLGGRKKKKKAKAAEPVREKKSEVKPAEEKEKKIAPARKQKKSAPAVKKAAPKRQAPEKTKTASPKPRKIVKKTDSFSPQEKLLHFIKAAPKGISLSQLSAEFKKPAAEIRVLIKKLMDRGVVEKVQKKYFLINGGQGK